MKTMRWQDGGEQIGAQERQAVYRLSRQDKQVERCLDRPLPVLAPAEGGPKPARKRRVPAFSVAFLFFASAIACASPQIPKAGPQSLLSTKKAEVVVSSQQPASSQTTAAPAADQRRGSEYFAAPDQVQADRQAKASDSTAPFRHAIVPHDETVVRVLLYHSLGSQAPRPAVKAHTFRRQIAWMQQAGVEIIHLSQLLDFMEGKVLLPRHAAVITIDDGENNGYSVAYQVLRERSVPFTLGIATDAIHERHKRGTLSWDQIREMVGSGLCEVASHSVTHRAMTSLPNEVVQRELERSRAILREELGLEPEAFFYPLGAQDRRIRRLTRLSGYRAAFVAQGGPTVAGTPRFRIPRYDVKPEALIWTFRSFFNHEIKMLADDSRGSGGRPTLSQTGNALVLRD
jgi:peptidoglycan/xylan/chitin deacetylase (PgdA/CDA1 family)